MGRTWLLRGVAVTVFAVVVGAWAVGLAQLGNGSPPNEKPSTPASSDDPDSIVLEKPTPPRKREADPSREGRTGPRADTTGAPADDATGTPTQPSTTPTSDPPSPSQEPSDPSPQPQTPSSPPSEPPDECTDLVDCVLDPITSQP